MEYIKLEGIYIDIRTGKKYVNPVVSEQNIKYFKEEA